MKLPIIDGHTVTVFWALRGGGAGSWGVVVNATFRTFPQFNASHQRTTIVVDNTDDARTLTELHAQHIFDWDDVQAAQYFYWRATQQNGVPKYTFTIDTVFPNVSMDKSLSLLRPLLGNFIEKGYNFTTSSAQADINDILTVSTDQVGGSAVMVSRFWPDDVYRNNVSAIGKAYQTLLNGGAAGYV